MSEPIRLWRDDKEIQVHGRDHAAALVAEGWQVGPMPAPMPVPVTAKQALAEAEPVQPAGDAQPAPRPEPPVRGKAGEYGTGAGTQRRVTKAQTAAAKKEKAQEKKDTGL